MQANAVMPWCGLLQSEAYAHTLLCQVLQSNGLEQMADEVRLWLMIQKETQEWGSCPSFVEAAAEVLRGSQKMLSAKIVSLSASRSIPFKEVKASGNGITVKRTFLREDGSLVEDGQMLALGEKITSVVKVWSEENRSFVRINCPRPANLLSDDQTSHLMWGRFSSAYRSYYSDRTDLWLEVLPEGNSEYREQFHVSQEGIFQTPLVSVESLYAPHYRANDGD